MNKENTNNISSFCEAEQTSPMEIDPLPFSQEEEKTSESNQQFTNTNENEQTFSTDSTAKRNASFVIKVNFIILFFCISYRVISQGGLNKEQITSVLCTTFLAFTQTNILRRQELTHTKFKPYK